MKLEFQGLAKIFMSNLKSHIDMRHEISDLKVFVVVIPNEGLVGQSFSLSYPKKDWQTNPSLGMTLTTEYNL